MFVLLARKYYFQVVFLFKLFTDWMMFKYVSWGFVIYDIISKTTSIKSEE